MPNVEGQVSSIGLIELIDLNGSDLDVFRQREIGVAGWFDFSC